MRLLTPCAIISYDALNYFIGNYSKKQTQIGKKENSKRNDMNLYFESSRISATELFHQNVSRVKASSWIFDQALNTPRNKLFSFQIKAALKVTTLGIRMSSTELLLWKNEKGSTWYPTLLKRDFATGIFLEILNFFWISYFKKQLQTT